MQLCNVHTNNPDCIFARICFGKSFVKLKQQRDLRNVSKLKYCMYFLTAISFWNWKTLTSMIYLSQILNLQISFVKSIFISYIIFYLRFCFILFHENWEPNLMFLNQTKLQKFNHLHTLLILFSLEKYFVKSK